ncbi:hypothetical protein D516_1013 [Rhodobacter sp. AKP1]|nr:hypothetical protein D516_1013 [Rhodobacter sp. AKP1]
MALGQPVPACGHATRLPCAGKCRCDLGSLRTSVLQPSAATDDAEPELAGG